MEASDFFISGFFSHAGDGEEQNTNNNNNINNNGNNFSVDDLLDIPKEDEVMADAFFNSITGNSGDSSTVTVVDSCNSSVSGGDGQFNGNMSCRSFTDAPFPNSELCVPFDDLAELEWLSNFVEESSFSSDDVPNLQFIPLANITSATNTTDSSSSATTISTGTNSPPSFPADTSVPGKARSKRSRAAPCDWSSRLQLLLSPATSSSESNNVSANSTTLATATANATATAKSTKAPSKKRESAETPGRKCLHCASDKTPQWRTGPFGPKTLCNACGVRYKSGRLVPEYRPASSPTFISAKHSNSHRKVLELRRQKDLQRHQALHHHQLVNQPSIFGVSNGGDEFLLHHHQNCGPNFRHLI